MITASSFPNIKDEARKKTHRELFREMRKFDEELESQGIDNLAQLLSSGGR